MASPKAALRGGLSFNCCAPRRPDAPLMGCCLRSFDRRAALTEAMDRADPAKAAQHFKGKKPPLWVVSWQQQPLYRVVSQAASPGPRRSHRRPAAHGQGRPSIRPNS